MFLSIIVSIIASASVYAALATAIVLVYRTNHVLTFHVGESGVLAAYVMVSVIVPMSSMPTGSLISGMIAAVAVTVGLAILLHVIIDQWGKKYGPFVGTVLTIAAAIIISGVTSLLWSGETKRLILISGQIYNEGGRVISLNSLFIFALCAFAVILVQLVVTRTSLGVAMRAVANNARLAQLRGVSVQRVLLIVWAFAGLLTAIGGIGLASLTSVAMEGAFVGVSAVVAAIIGGMTSLPGAILGALLLATGEQLISIYFDARYSQVVPILALVIVLVIRPSGISGKVEQIARL